MDDTLQNLLASDSLQLLLQKNEYIYGFDFQSPLFYLSIFEFVVIKFLLKKLQELRNKLLSIDVGTKDIYNQNLLLL